MFKVVTTMLTTMHIL